jgi:HEAT repeat protein
MTGAATVLSRLRSSRSGKRRAGAARALATHDCRAAADALIEALGDPDPGVRSDAAVALASLRDPATIGPLAGVVADWTAPALAEGRRAALQTLLAFRSPEAAVTLARWIAAGAGAVSRADEAALLAAVEADASGTAAPLAARALGELAGRANGAAGDRAAALLGLLPDHCAGVLLPLLRDGESPAARRRAVYGLASCSRTEVVDGLIAAVRDRAVEVRLEAVRALGDARDPAALGALQHALHDVDDGVRESARVALGALGTVGTVAAMAASLSGGPATTPTSGVGAPDSGYPKGGSRWDRRERT